MTDADVDGAHIAALLMTYFYQEMPGLITGGHLFLARPPLFRITILNQTYYAQDEKEKADIIGKHAKANSKVEVGRFKGLGEMTPPQLKETTMNPESRVLLQVMIDDDEKELVAKRVDELMGRKPEHRFTFIQEQTALRGAKLLDELDV